jgi:anti-sigma B factor antagonist
MRIHLEERYNAAIIHLKGRLMGGPDAKHISDKIHQIIDKGMKNVVLDMSGVNFINSTGMGILISSYVTMKNCGGDLKLASIDNKIQGVLSITKLNQVLDEYKTIDDALETIH